MNDNDLRAPQWQQLVGEFMPTRLGRRKREWARANREAFAEVLFRYQPRWAQEPLSTFWDDYLFDWLRVMCEQVGVGVPGREEAVSIAWEASAYITRRVHSAFPGAVDAIRQLHASGYLLHTASAEHSDELTGYLEAMGIRDLFGRLYGPDLVDLPFRGPQYYQRLFEESGAVAVESIVVDDSLQRAAWAMDAGASAVLVSRDHSASDVGCPVISSLAELPALIEAMARP